MTTERDPEQATQAEIREQAAGEGDDRTTRQEEAELDRRGAGEGADQAD